MERHNEIILATVVQPQQAREALYAERSVWTPSMLDRLAKSEEGTKWFRLFDKVYGDKNLRTSAAKVINNKGGKGIDGQTTTQFEEKLEEEISWLQSELRDGKYDPEPSRRVEIPKPGSKEKRPLGIQTVRDRVVQTALRNVIEPIFEHEFAEHSYGFRRGLGAKDALRRVEQLLHRGNLWVVDADLRKFFDTIPQDLIMSRLGEKIVDGSVLTLIKRFLQAGIMDAFEGWVATEEGTPQGAVISPLLANIVLNPLDHLIASAGFEMTRYADDFVILCRTEEQAEQALNKVRSWCQRQGLELHETKTRIINLNQTGRFDFLGYAFVRKDNGQLKKWFRRKSEAKLKASIRAKTGRLRPGSMEQIIADINPIIRGWWAYFRWSAKAALADVDGWIRHRLRSIQRKRWKRKGICKGRENAEIPNSKFREAGLFCMAEARLQWIQSLAGTH